jgi:hypothetical protein
MFRRLRRSLRATTWNPGAARRPRPSELCTGGLGPAGERDERGEVREPRRADLVRPRIEEHDRHARSDGRAEREAVEEVLAHRGAAQELLRILLRHRELREHQPFVRSPPGDAVEAVRLASIRSRMVPEPPDRRRDTPHERAERERDLVVEEVENRRPRSE